MFVHVRPLLLFPIGQRASPGPQIVLEKALLQQQMTVHISYLLWQKMIWFLARRCSCSHNSLKGIPHSIHSLGPIFIGPESDHWLCLSLTNSCLVNLIDVTLACEDANSKLVEVVTIANVDHEDRVGNSWLHTWKLRLGYKAKLLFRLWAQGLVKVLKLKFRQDF